MSSIEVISVDESALVSARRRGKYARPSTLQRVVHVAGSWMRRRAWLTSERATALILIGEERVLWDLWSAEVKTENQP